MIRRILFILFLYILLVWAIAAWLNLGDPRKILTQGLLWTAIGIAAILLWVIAERAVTAWRSRSAQAKSRPAAPARSGNQPMHEDDAALKSLLYQAGERLKAAGQRIEGQPVFLCIGPEASGKTSVVQNSGLDPTLLAGQIAGGGAALASTRVANLWLAQRSLFVEIGGRVFSSDRGRISEFLSVLFSGFGTARWKTRLRLEKPLSINAVLLFFDTKEFTKSPEPSRLDRAAQHIRQCLTEVARCWGETPVYVLFTKADSVDYFAEYFARMSDVESGQVFGTLTEDIGSERQDRVWGEAATRHLGRLFQAIFLRLNDRRLIALTKEGESSRKPSVYEFPREFKKIRGPLVQFLVDIFKPDPLTPIPRLRGFFFVGTRKVERSVKVSNLETQRAYRPMPAGSEATQFFNPGMMTTYGDPASGKGARPASGVLSDQWVFATEFFTRVLPSDRPATRVASQRPLFGAYQKIAAGIAAALAALLMIVWTVSWVGNLRLSGFVESAVDEVLRTPPDLSFASLTALDHLREQLQRLDEEDSWSLHWGLYTGDSLRKSAQIAYFGQLKRAALDRVNQTLAVHLQMAGANGDSPGGIYDRLKTHRTITALGCPVDRNLISGVMKTAAGEIAPNLGQNESQLLGRQLEFYAAFLEKNKTNPVMLGEDQGAEGKARDYIQNAGGYEQRFRSMLAALHSEMRPSPVSGAVENYRTVLKGRDDYDAVFTPKGLAAFNLQLEQNDSGALEPCVMGRTAAAERKVLDFGAKDRLRTLFLRQYADSWKDFLASYAVIRYSGVHDAVGKLDTLASSTSPLLGIVRLVASNMNYPPAKPDEPSYWEGLVTKFGGGGLVQAKSQAAAAKDQAQQLVGGDERVMKQSDLWRLFQPALFTVPPESDQLVNDKNRAYINALRSLKDSLDALDRASAAERPAAINQARTALGQAHTAHDGLSDNFSNAGNEGVNKLVSDLLDEPIRLAGVPGMIPANSVISDAGKHNGALAPVCRAIAPTLAKFPFNPNEQRLEATPNEIAAAFAPQEGQVWKYVQKSGADLVVLNGKEWQQKPDLQGVRVNPDLLIFLNRAQGLTSALFGGTTSMTFRYTLRPVKGPTTFRLVLDGAELKSQDVLQKQFVWPAAAGAKQGAEGILEFSGGRSGFGRFDGLWGVFRFFDMAEQRPLLTKSVQWSENRGLGGSAPQPIDPPVKVEILDFPGGVDLFNPKFFEGLQCPKTAVSAN